MLNEGLIVNDSAALVKSEIVRQIRRLGSCNPDELERAVFEALVGRSREEVDWEIEDNQAGYYTWVQSFDGLVQELIADGYILSEKPGTLVPTEAEQVSEYSHVPGGSNTLYLDGHVAFNRFPGMFPSTVEFARAAGGEITTSNFTSELPLSEREYGK